MSEQVAIEKSEKDWTVVLILALVAGPLGVHRFYAGKVGTGIFQFLTLGGFGIWSLIDLIMIALGKFTDGDGKVIANK